VKATNLRTLVIDAKRARVSCNPKVNLTSDGPTDVVITGCGSVLPKRRKCVDRRRFSFRLHHGRRQRVVAVDVFVNGKRKIRRRGHDIRRVTLKRLPKRRFVMRIVARQSGGG
jgi:hypothetical protein